MLNTNFTTCPEIWEEYGFTLQQHERRNKKALTFIFHFEKDVVVTLRVLLDDYTGSDFTITNMTVFPESKRREGFGSNALEKLLRFAREYVNAKTFQATQVQKDAEGFWRKNGFIACEESSVTNDFILI